MQADELLRLARRPIETLNVPEWGETCVRGLSVSEYDRFEMESAKGESKEPDVGWLLRFGVVDANGVHVFGDSHVPQLNTLPARIGTLLSRAIYRLSLAGVDVEKKSPATNDSEP